MKNIARYITVTLLVLTGIITATAQDIFLPDDPGRSTPHHKLKIVSTEANNIIIEVYTHSANGYFDMMYDDVNISHSDANISMTLAEGDSIKIWNSTYSWSGWEYTYMEMDGKKIHENQHLASYGDNEMPTFVMPNHDATIYVYATFDPSTPGVEQADNPYCGMWNAETGELFVNNFVPYIPDYHTGYYGMGKDGYLLVGAINRAVYDYNISKADVRILTVSGEMGHGNDNIALENVHTLDLRHTYGYKSYYGLWYDNKTWYDNIFDQYVFSSALRRLILPSNIQGLSDGAFEGWNGEWKLEELTCYAVTPPMVNDNTLTPLPSTCVLYVPEQSVAAYKADKHWSRFKTIKGIQEAEDVTVDLPDNFTDGRYRGMSLELLNAENGESRKYVVDERGQYVYRGLVSGARYTALLRSPKNGIIAQTDTMLLDDQPIEMTFPRVVGMDEVVLTVKADGKDVTGDVTIGWTDRKGASLGSGPKLEQQIEGSRVYYSIKLPSQLATLYQQPPTTDHIVGINKNVIALDLLPLDSVSISGVVKDAEGNRIGGATVVIAQTVNGQISKSFVTTTDGSGRFALKALAGPVARSVSLAGYITNRQELTLSSEKTTTDTITLAPLSGAVISYDFTYTESGLTGEAVTTLPSYSDYQNVGITAYNATTRKELTDISVQYPQVVILSGAKKGDRIRLTATSLAGSFKTVEQSVTISDDETANVTIPIVQYGG
ncbi:MAG: carboxypeptidase regulatory-like domain-containing protein, partial [Prevotella sp.]|nr:carboxypeptidase regulatory-like domain-containing protein [Prevotella sp.]